MSSPVALAVAVVLLAGGTFAFRFAGPVLRSRVTIPEQADTFIDTAAVVLLVAVIATTALLEGDGFAGIARPAGVLVAGVLAWRRAPFAVVVLAAAATAGGLRLLGVP